MGEEVEVMLRRRASLMRPDQQIIVGSHEGLQDDLIAAATVIASLRASLTRVEEERDEAREALKPFVIGAHLFYSEDPDDRAVSLGRWFGDDPFQRFFGDTRLTVADVRRGYVALGLSRASPTETERSE